MSHPPAQAFCTNCGQPLPGGASLCPRCGVAVGASPAGCYRQPAAYQPPSAPYPLPPDPNAALLAAGAEAGARERRLRRRPRAQRPRSRLRGCGCLFLILAALAAPFAGAALTHGHVQTIFEYVAAAMMMALLGLAFIGMLLSRRGREAVGEAATEGCVEGCLEALTGGLFGG